ncbi:MAG: Wzz/FepE/Etk N-terminal domain-containing protein [Chloroherpetonaceae bacterium]|nr:Wzz/FepE/Etk N-terminal domain-containing protein [Chloroherpetonaceae bacterium]
MTEFISIVRTLLKKWKLWVAIPILSAAVMYGLTFNEKKVYQSDALMQLNLQQSKSLSLTEDALQQHEINLRFENLIELLKSQRTLEEVRVNSLRDFYLAKHQFFNWELAPFPISDSLEVIALLDSISFESRESAQQGVNSEKWQKLSRFLDQEGVSGEDLQKATSIGRIRNSAFIRVSFEADSPKKAVYFAGLMIDAMISQYAFLSRSRSSFDREMYERLVREAKTVVDQKIKGLERYKVQNNVINLGEHTKAIVGKLVELEIERTHLRETEASKSRALEKLREAFQSRGSLPINITSNARLVKLKEELTLLNQRRIQNRVSLESIVDTTIEIQIANLKSKIESEIKTLIRDQPYDIRESRQDLLYRYTSNELELSAVTESLPILEREIERMSKYANRFAPLESNIGTMEKEIYVAQESYLVLLNKLNLAKSVELGQSGTDITIIDPPKYPSSAEPSKRLMLILLAGVATFILVVVTLVLIELLDKSVQSVEHYEARSPFQVICAIPSSESTESSSIAPVQVAQIKNEQLKRLRKHFIQNQNEEKVTLWFSTHQSEGVFDIARDTQSLLTKAGYRCLILHAGYEPSNTNDVTIKKYSEIINGESLSSIISESILTFDPSEGSPFEQRTPNMWQADFNILKTQFDFIFILPPALVESTDWSEWAQVTDAALHIFKANRLFSAADLRLTGELSRMIKVGGAVVFSPFIEKMESLIGEAPKKRSRLRIFAKQILQHSFGKAA